MITYHKIKVEVTASNGVEYELSIEPAFNAPHFEASLFNLTTNKQANNGEVIVIKNEEGIFKAMSSAINILIP
tara:strand:+ start:284 stop:502 length:219 start_codon:yes stop_codon:yes gene_type:complete